MSEEIFEYLGKGAVCVGVAAFFIVAAPIYALAYIALRLGIVK
jgi:hypothetical protein